MNTNGHKDAVEGGERWVGGSSNVIDVPRHWVRPVRENDLPLLRERAEADAHAVIAPTHVFEKRGPNFGDLQIVGYASLAAVPLLLPWFDTQRVKAADSLYYLNQLENLLANLMPQQSAGLICVPVVQKSPFQPHIARLGYTDAGMASITFKKVR